MPARAVRKLALTSVSVAAIQWLALSPALAPSAAAQAANAETGAQASAPEGVLETVIVTARKREESSQDVPSSLSTVRGDALVTLTSGGADMNAFSARVPSLVVESSFGRVFPRFYIRGLGNSDFDLNASQPVSLVYDDVVFENPVLKGFPVFDVERIEVLRGPQGTLFGRNTPAGIVKFDSVKPSTNAPNHVRAGLRSRGGYELEAAAGAELGEGIHARASLFFHGQDDWVTNTGSLPIRELGGYADYAGRLQLRFRPNERLDALFNVHARDLSGTSQLFRANVITAGRRGLNGNFDQNEVSYDQGQGNNQDLTSKGVNIRVTYDFGAVTLTSVSAWESVEFYGRGDIDGGDLVAGPGTIPFPSDTADGIDAHDQWSQELRLSSNGDGPTQWQAGLYWFQEDLSIYSLAFATPTFVFSDARQVQDTTSWALFGSLSHQATDRLNLSAGLRWSDDDKSLTARGGIANLAPITEEVSDGALSWDLSAVYEASDTTNLYARLARGYRAPSIQGRLLFGVGVTVAQSEFVTSLEGGVKYVSPDRRLRFDLSAFALKIDDQQFTAIGGAGNFNQLLNADEGRGWGLEAELQWLPTEQLSLAASLSYNHTEINDANLTVGACGAPCTVLDPVSGGNANIDGNPFPNAPEWIGNVSARYEWPLANGTSFYVLTDWSYKGETNFFLYESIEFSEGGFWEGGLRAAFVKSEQDWEVAIYGRNILNEQRLVGGIDFNNLTGFVNAPRVWGLEAKLGW